MVAPFVWDTTEAPARRSRLLRVLGNALAAKSAAVSYATISTALREFGEVSEPPGFEQVTPGTQGSF